MLPSPRLIRRSGVPPRGFTLAEVMIAISIGAIITALGTPMITRMRASFAVRGARQDLLTTVEAARSAATQRGRPGRFIVRGNAVFAVVDTAPPGQPVVGTFTVRQPQPFDAAYNVTLSLANAADSVVQYDARGFANPRVGHTVRIVIDGKTAKDSVCLTSFGQILPPGCVP